MSTVGAMAVGAVAPNLLVKSALASKLAANATSTGPILVVVQLAGGNDGLNTIVPFASDLYYRDRPYIAVPRSSALSIDGMVGFNPNLKGLKGLYDAGKVAVVQGVGYPNPDRSHFRSTEIWETADPAGMARTGWIGRYLDEAIADTTNPFAAVALGARVPLTLLSSRVPVTSIESVDRFKFLVNQDNSSLILQAYQEMYGTSGEKLPPYVGLVRQAGANAEQGVQELHGIATNYKPFVQYPKSTLGQELQLVAQIISAGLGTRVFHVTVGGFDDHVAEVYTHARVLQDVGDSMAAFYGDLKGMGKVDDVVTMTFSEFGRRVKENAGRGTDHGTAAPLFVVGNKVKGGLYGQDPILSNLDGNGDLKFGVDFRSVYSTVLDGWMGGDSRTILGASYDRLSFL